MAFIRKIKKGNSVYLALVENYREGGKVRQRTLKYLGKEFQEGKAFKKIYPQEIEIGYVKRYADSIVVDKLAKELSLHDLFREYNMEILLLVYSHLLEGNLPINQIQEWVETTYLGEVLQMEKISTKKVYRALDYLSMIDFSDIEDRIYKILRDKIKDEGSVILDVTDTYFTDSNGYFGEKSRRGKDGKYKRLLQISLAINKVTGFPVFHKVYEGNISNLKILRDMVFSLKERRGVEEFIVMDRGMGSKGNIGFLEDLGFRVVSGLKRAKELEGLVDSIDREEIFCAGNRIKLINTSVYAMEFSYLRGKVIVVYNPMLEVVRREFAYEYKRGVEKARYLGYSFIYTNTSLKKDEVVRLYFEKEIIERSFKQLKGVLSLRPIRVWLREHIIAHIRICYLAYCVLSLLSYYLKGLDISATKALEELRRSYIVGFRTMDGEYEFQRVFLKNIHEDIFDKLGVVYKI